MTPRNPSNQEPVLAYGYHVEEHEFPALSSAPLPTHIVDLLLRFYSWVLLGKFHPLCFLSMRCWFPMQMQDPTSHRHEHP